MFRTVGDHEDVCARCSTRAIGTLVPIEDVLVVPPVRLTTVPGFDTAVFSFTTDIPFLDRWGAPLLLGPGSVTRRAHRRRARRDRRAASGRRSVRRASRASFDVAERIARDRPSPAIMLAR